MAIGIVWTFLLILTGNTCCDQRPAILIAVLFSMATGIVFGLLPAVRAADPDPIAALRRE